MIQILLNTILPSVVCLAVYSFFYRQVKGLLV